MSLDLETRLDIVKLYYRHGESATAALRAYKTVHHLHKDPFSVQAITNLIHKFEFTKSLHDIPSTGRPSLSESRRQEVEESLTRLQASNVHGHASTSAVASDTGIPQRSVARMLRSFGMYPYKITLCQEITKDDKAARIHFSQWVLDHQHLLKDIMWSDEAYFSLDGTVNRHNCVIWAYQNPHATVTESLHPEKVCVWMGFSAKHKLQPFFFNTTVDQFNYTDLLEHHLLPQLKQKKIFNSVIFQHDGAPPHFSHRARQFLSSHFPEERVIGRGFGYHWPPRSPDLSPLDYYLWGTLKARVYHQFKPTSIASLKEKICAEIQAVTIDELTAAVENLHFRCELVLEQNGSHIQQLL